MQWNACEEVSLWCFFLELSRRGGKSRELLLYSLLTNNFGMPKVREYFPSIGLLKWQKSWINLAVIVDVKEHKRFIFKHMREVYEFWVFLPSCKNRRNIVIFGGHILVAWKKDEEIIVPMVSISQLVLVKRSQNEKVMFLATLTIFVWDSKIKCVTSVQIGGSRGMKANRCIFSRQSYAPRSNRFSFYSSM